MTLVLRPGTPADANACGSICFEAFRAIDDEHNFPWDFPSAEVATGLLTMMLSHGGFFAVVAEDAGKVVGSNFLDERDPIAGVGPITVDPASQNGTMTVQVPCGCHYKQIADEGHTAVAVGCYAIVAPPSPVCR